MEKFPDEIYIETKAEQIEANNDSQKYESNEHRDIGNFAFYLFQSYINSTNTGESEKIKKLFDDILKEFTERKIYNPFSNSLESIPVYTLAINKSLNLNPGEIVALAGDFIGIPDKPIAFGQDEQEQEERFEAALNGLKKNDSVTQDKIKKLAKHIDEDANATSPHAHWSLKFKKKVKDLVDMNNIEYAIEMKSDDDWFWHSPYFKLAMNNFDHFGEEAKIAFLAGHRLAVKKANEAGKEGQSETMQKQLLREGLIYELFACHFLTDLFAAGHIRVPRKEILNYLTQVNNNQSVPTNLEAIPDLASVSDLNLSIAGVFARKMHDEDGNEGIWVTTPNEEKKQSKAESWKALGDGNYYKEENSENAKRVCELMELVLKDLIQAFNQKGILFDKKEILDSYLPKPHIVDDGFEETKTPMFYIENNQLYCRGELFKEIQEKGILKGIKQGVPCLPENMAMVSCRFFNVKVKPAVQLAQEKTNQVADSVVQKVDQLVELTEDKVYELYEKLSQLPRPSCNIL